MVRRSKKKLVSKHRGMPRSGRGGDVTSAYIALLMADHWLFLADCALKLSRKNADNDIVAIRDSVAGYLSKLQDKAYNALDRGNP